VWSEGERDRMGSPLRFTAGAASRPPPGLGEHTYEVLKQMGLDEKELEELTDSGVIKAA
jgi:crotonobetainyl-CoA:carnitine CoA-transferase CaiB-like acyl-CoA transferase